MGAYAGVLFNGVELYSSKNTVYYEMLNLFSPNDYLEMTIEDNEGCLRHLKKFTITCKTAKKRLDIIGYSLGRALEEFKRNIDLSKYYTQNCPTELEHILSRFYDADEDRIRYDLIENMTIENFNYAVKQFLSNPLQKDPTGDVVLDYIIQNNRDFYGLGFPAIDPLYEVRIILNSLNDNDVVEYDLTEIIDNGCIELDDIFSFWNKIGFNSISNKTIILTEGTTDIYVLRKSLNLLYPQYKHLYNFFDFHNTKSPGSTSSLVNLLKGFINAGITERIIALFDNDTAAYEALSSLDKEKLTENIRIIHLPNLDWAMDYPTIGPIGKINTDINKFASSIELFVGRNLIVNNGEYIPIQWTGYNHKLKRYQGEILFKKEIFKSFCEIVKKVEQNGIQSVEHDWEQLRYLWETIFATFID